MLMKAEYPHPGLVVSHEPLDDLMGLMRFDPDTIHEFMGTPVINDHATEAQVVKDNFDNVIAIFAVLDDGQVVFHVTSMFDDPEDLTGIDLMLDALNEYRHLGVH